MFVQKKILDFNEQLKNNRYRLTLQRKAILDLFAENSSKHLNAYEVCEILLEKDINVGKSTVYRTLLLLEKLKLITRIYLDDGCIRYQIVDSSVKDEHNHLICEGCGNLFEIKDDLLDILEKLACMQHGFSVTNHSVKLFGICKKCKEI
jgi:Fur family ferric uptake transcriptional regulator